MTSEPLLRLDDCGLRCEAGAFHVDPSRAVERAIITHAHTDHARRGCRHYIGSRSGAPILKARLGGNIRLQTLEFGAAAQLGEVSVSLHPAGHVLGSAQVRVEAGGQVWVVTGDFKRDADPSCEPFELVGCDTLITEATFGLPEYRWQPAAQVVEAIHEWWTGAPQRASVLFCYAFGKTQRVLAELARFTDRPVYLHADAARITDLYRAAGISMVATVSLASVPKGRPLRGELIIAPPSTRETRWMRRLGDAQTGFVSGWMQRGAAGRPYDRGFALSDHADWPQLVATVRESGARTVYVTHGESETLARHLRDALRIDARPLLALGRAGGGNE